MKILLTGAQGFLGRHCLALLRARGHEVVATDCRAGAALQGDLADAAFARTLPEVEAVVHAAAVQYVSPELPLLARRRWFRRHNVEATRALVTRYAGSGTHFVHIGTSMMYAQDGSPCYGSGSPMRGQGVYSRSKLAAQALVEERMAHWACIVPCIIGGVGREGLFRGFVQSMLRHGRVLVPGAGRHPIHMVHVEDVAALVATVVERRAQGFFNAAAPAPLSITGWVAEIADELGLPPPRIVHLPLPPLRLLAALSGWRLLAREQVLMLGQPHVLDIAGALALGWTPRHDNARIARDIGRHIACGTVPEHGARSLRS